MSDRRRYRVELWVEGEGDPDRMPDVNATALARTPERAVAAVGLRAARACGEIFWVEDVHVIDEQAGERCDSEAVQWYAHASFGPARG